VGFGREKGQPNLSVSLRILDDKGKATTAKPATGKVDKDVPEKAQGLPMQFLVALNRAGTFTLELSVTDETAGKTAKVSVPFKVVEHR
jgi:hypothetical protein